MSSTEPETLTCPNCQHSLTSARTRTLDDSNVVGCKRCELRSTLGEWRAFATAPPRLPTGDQNVSDSDSLVAPKPIPDVEIGTAATSSSSFHSKLECPYGHKFETKTTEEGKQVACPECGTFVLVPKTGLIAILVTLALPFLLCGGCLMLVNNNSSSKSSFESQFSAWDGSHYAVNERIKSSMNDPNSFEHVKTVYFEVDDYYIVKTTFRGKNAFGGTVTSTANAEVSRSGTVMDMTID